MIISGLFPRFSEFIKLNFFDISSINVLANLINEVKKRRKNEQIVDRNKGLKIFYSFKKGVSKDVRLKILLVL